MDDSRRLSPDAIVKDDYDREDIARMRTDIPALEVALEKLRTIAPTAPTLMDDLIASFLKAVPRQPERDEVRPSHLVNWQVLRETMDLPAWQGLRRSTVGDVVSTAMATMTIEPDVETLYDRLSKAQQEADNLQAARDAQADAAGEAASLEEQLAELGDPEDDDGDKAGVRATLSEDLQSTREQVEALAQLGDKAAERLQTELDRATPEIRRALNNAIEGATAQLDGLERAAQSWGVDRGELVRMNAKERFDLAKKLSTPAMRQLADMIGAFRLQFNQEQERRTTDVPHEIVDVTQGDSLENMLPDELLRLTDEDFENEFYKDFLERNLAQYKLEGTERLGKGGIIACTDSSGSMRGAKHTFATATAMALLHFARKEKREFRWIHFATAHEIAEFDFTDPASFKMDRMIEAAELFFRGAGTDFEAPLELALSRLEEENARTGVVRADIVFITDGQARVSDRWMENFKAAQERLKFAVWGVMIGGRREAEPLFSICDTKVVSVHDLASGDDITQVMRGL